MMNASPNVLNVCLSGIHGQRKNVIKFNVINLCLKGINDKNVIKFNVINLCLKVINDKNKGRLFSLELNR